MSAVSIDLAYLRWSDFGVAALRQGSSGPFIEFSVRVFDALDARGWRRFDPSDWHPGVPAVVETFPLAAWRCLKLKNLPAKNRARPNDIRHCFESLTNSGLVSGAGAIPAPSILS